MLSGLIIGLLGGKDLQQSEEHSMYSGTVISPRQSQLKVTISNKSQKFSLLSVFKIKQIP